MRVESKFGKLATSLLGLVSYFLDRAKRSNSSVKMSGAHGHFCDIPGRDSHQMQRATDSEGQEYFCPVCSLKDPNFVSQSEKKHCFEYDIISRHEVAE